jgi:DNA gyrase inhibitor GyrI
MNAPAVRIENLAPLRVASFRAAGSTPEQYAWDKLQRWAGPQGLFRDLSAHPVFGFNNPAPVRGGREYGYEFWIGVGPEARSEGGGEVKDFAGGLYAVTTCKLVGDPHGSLPDVWRSLWEFSQSGHYRWRPTHELERPHNPQAGPDEMILDLLLPIAVRGDEAAPR